MEELQKLEELNNLLTSAFSFISSYCAIYEKMI